MLPPPPPPPPATSTDPPPPPHRTPLQPVPPATAARTSSRPHYAATQSTSRSIRPGTASTVDSFASASPEPQAHSADVAAARPAPLPAAAAASSSSPSSSAREVATSPSPPPLSPPRPKPVADIQRDAFQSGGRRSADSSSHRSSGVAVSARSSRSSSVSHHVPIPGGLPRASPADAAPAPPSRSTLAGIQAAGGGGAPSSNAPSTAAASGNTSVVGLGPRIGKSFDALLASNETWVLSQTNEVAKDRDDDDLAAAPPPDDNANEAAPTAGRRRSSSRASSSSSSVRKLRTPGGGGSAARSSSASLRTEGPSTRSPRSKILLLASTKAPWQETPHRYHDVAPGSTGGSLLGLDVQATDAAERPSLAAAAAAVATAEDRQGATHQSHPSLARTSMRNVALTAAAATTTTTSTTTTLPSVRTRASTNGQYVFAATAATVGSSASPPGGVAPLQAPPLPLPPPTRPARAMERSPSTSTRASSNRYATPPSGGASPAMEAAPLPPALPVATKLAARGEAAQTLSRGVATDDASSVAPTATHHHASGRAYGALKLATTSSPELKTRRVVSAGTSGNSSKVASTQHHHPRLPHSDGAEPLPGGSVGVGGSSSSSSHHSPRRHRSNVQLPASVQADVMLPKAATPTTSSPSMESAAAASGSAAPVPFPATALASTDDDGGGGGGGGGAASRRPLAPEANARASAAPPTTTTTVIVGGKAAALSKVHPSRPTVPLPSGASPQPQPHPQPISLAQEVAMTPSSAEPDKSSAGGGGGGGFFTQRIKKTSGFLKKFRGGGGGGGSGGDAAASASATPGTLAPPLPSAVGAGGAGKAALLSRRASSGSLVVSESGVSARSVGAASVPTNYADDTTTSNSSSRGGVPVVPSIPSKYAREAATATATASNGRDVAGGGGGGRESSLPQQGGLLARRRKHREQAGGGGGGGTGSVGAGVGNGGTNVVSSRSSEASLVPRLPIEPPARSTSHATPHAESRGAAAASGSGVGGAPAVDPASVPASSHGHGHAHSRGSSTSAAGENSTTSSASDLRHALATWSSEMDSALQGSARDLEVKTQIQAPPKNWQPSPRLPEFEGIGGVGGKKRAGSFIEETELDEVRSRDWGSPPPMMGGPGVGVGWVGEGAGTAADGARTSSSGTNASSVPTPTSRSAGGGGGGGGSSISSPAFLSPAMGSRSMPSTPRPDGARTAAAPQQSVDSTAAAASPRSQAGRGTASHPQATGSSAASTSGGPSSMLSPTTFVTSPNVSGGGASWTPTHPGRRESSSAVSDRSFETAVDPGSAMFTRAAVRENAAAAAGAGAAAAPASAPAPSSKGTSAGSGAAAYDEMGTSWAKLPELDSPVEAESSIRLVPPTGRRLDVGGFEATRDSPIHSPTVSGAADVDAGGAAVAHGRDVSGLGPLVTLGGLDRRGGSRSPSSPHGQRAIGGGGGGGGAMAGRLPGLGTPSHTSRGVSPARSVGRASVAEENAPSGATTAEAGGSSAHPPAALEERAKAAADKCWEEDETLVKKEKIAEWLGGVAPLNRAALPYYMAHFDFAGLRVDHAFRRLCDKLFLRAETQQVDRILHEFSRRYWECNPSALYGNADVVHSVVFSVLLLNTDLHVAELSERMTRNQFVRNTLSAILETRAAAEAAPPTSARANLGSDESLSSLGAPATTGAVGEGEAPLTPASVGVKVTTPASATPLEPTSASTAQREKPKSSANSVHGSSLTDGSAGRARSKAWEVELEAHLKEIYAAVKADQIRLPTGDAERDSLSPSMNTQRRTPRSVSALKRGSIRGLQGLLGAGAGGVPGGSLGTARSEDNASAATSASLGSRGDSWYTHVTPTTSTRSSPATSTSSAAGTALPSLAAPSLGFASTLSHTIIKESQDEDETQSIASVPDDIDDDELALMGPPWAKEGVLTRKHYWEAPQKRARDKAWVEVFVVVQKGTLSMFRFGDNSSVGGGGASTTATAAVGGGNWLSSALPLGSISLAHTLANALPPPGYNRQRPHVFALTLPTGAVYFFQAGHEELVQEWVSTCNYWAARQSREPLAAGVSNMEYGWNRLLPDAHRDGDDEYDDLDGPGDRYEGSEQLHGGGGTTRSLGHGAAGAGESDEVLADASGGGTAAAAGPYPSRGGAYATPSSSSAARKMGAHNATSTANAAATASAAADNRSIRSGRSGRSLQARATRVFFPGSPPPPEGSGGVAGGPPGGSIYNGFAGGGGGGGSSVRGASMSVMSSGGGGGGGGSRSSNHERGGGGTGGAGAGAQASSERVHIHTWVAPMMPTSASTLREEEQLESVQRHLAQVESELEAHNALREPLQRLYAPRSTNASRATANWSRKSNHLLSQLTKCQVYAESLRSSAKLKADKVAQREMESMMRRADQELARTRVEEEGGPVPSGR